MANSFSRAAWHSYYCQETHRPPMAAGAPARRLECERILAIGPGLGLVTSLLVNLGYEVETLDVLPRAFDVPRCAAPAEGRRELRSAEIAGY